MESDHVVRDEVLGRFPDLDLSFPIARLGEEVSNEGSVKDEEGVNVEIVGDEVEVAASERGEKVDGSTFSGGVLAIVEEQTGRVPKGGEAKAVAQAKATPTIPQPVTSEEIFR